MAKSQRASSTKVNNAAFKKNIAGPIEKARAERLSAKLLELSQAPRASEQKKTEDATMDVSDAPAAAPLKSAMKPTKPTEDMEVDQTPKPSHSKSKTSGRVQKARKSNRSSAIAFKVHKGGKKAGGRAAKK